MVVCALDHNNPPAEGQDEIKMALIVVQDPNFLGANSKSIQSSLSLASSVSVKTLLEHVSLLIKYPKGSYRLHLKNSLVGRPEVCIFVRVPCC